jgi:hypothetical protein
LVKADISSAAPASSSTADSFVAFDLTVDASNITAIDKDGNSVTPTGTANGTTSPTTSFGVAAYGSMAVVAASDTPDKSIDVMGTTDNESSKFKLTGTHEGWYINRFSTVLIDGDETNYYPDITNGHGENFTAVKLKSDTEPDWNLQLDNLCW